MNHIYLFILVAFLVSLAFSFLMREEKKERIIFGLKMFFGLTGFGLIAGWVMYFLP